MPEGIGDNTQRVCDSQPYCLCVGEVNDWDECCCGPAMQQVGEFFYCGKCRRPLILIHFETGEPV